VQKKRSAEQPEIRGLMVDTRVRTLSIEPALIWLRGIADEDAKVTKKLSDIVEGETRGVATQEVAHHLGLSVENQPACPGCRARPFGVSSPWIACGRCGQAATEHCARCCPTGTQDLARHEARFQQALDETIQEALGQNLTTFADHSMFSVQKLDQWLLHHHIKADAMEIMACEQRWRHLKRVQGDPDDASRPSEEAVAISRQQQLAAASSSQHQQAAASSCQQWPQQPATSVEMQNEWAYADVVTGWVYGRYDVRPVGLQLRLVGTRRAIRLCDRPAPPPEASARADPRLVCQLPKVHGWDLVSAKLRSHVARQTTEEEQEQQRKSSRGASSRSSGRAWSRSPTPELPRWSQGAEGALEPATVARHLADSFSGRTAIATAAAGGAR
jgi:hypothetical protein